MTKMIEVRNKGVKNPKLTQNIDLNTIVKFLTYTVYQLHIQRKHLTHNSL
jgi:hypothetical protein